MGAGGPQIQHEGVRSYPNLCALLGAGLTELLENVMPSPPPHISNRIHKVLKVAFKQELSSPPPPPIFSEPMGRKEL